MFFGLYPREDNGIDISRPDQAVNKCVSGILCALGRYDRALAGTPRALAKESACFLWVRVLATADRCGAARNHRTDRFTLCRRNPGGSGAGPYFICGHCWGGAVAFEIAAKFEASGDNVTGLLMLESVPPSGSEATAYNTPAPDRPVIAKAVSDLCKQVREKLSRLPAELAQKFGPVSWELIDLALRYRATTRIRAPLFLIRTPTHPKAVFQNWSHLTSGHVEERIVPGDTFSILVAPVVKIVGEELDAALRGHSDQSLRR